MITSFPGDLGFEVEVLVEVQLHDISHYLVLEMLSLLGHFPENDSSDDYL